MESINLLSPKGTPNSPFVPNRDQDIVYWSHTFYDSQSVSCQEYPGWFHYCWSENSVPKWNTLWVHDSITTEINYRSGQTLILYTPLRSVEINALTHLVLTPISKFLKSSSCSAIFSFLFHQHLVPGKHSNVYRMYEVNEISSEGKRMREMDVQTLATKMTIQSFAHIHVLVSFFPQRNKQWMTLISVFLFSSF